MPCADRDRCCRRAEARRALAACSDRLAANSRARRARRSLRLPAAGPAAISVDVTRRCPAATPVDVTPRCAGPAPPAGGSARASPARGSGLSIGSARPRCGLLSAMNAATSASSRSLSRPRSRCALARMSAREFPSADPNRSDNVRLWRRSLLRGSRRGRRRCTCCCRSGSEARGSERRRRVPLAWSCRSRPCRAPSACWTPASSSEGPLVGSRERRLRSSLRCLRIGRGGRGTRLRPSSLTELSLRRIRGGVVPPR